MKTDNQSISEVLTLNSTSFYIPPFQRAYAWGKPEIERYFSDILRIIESEFDNKQQDKLEHFFGTLVIKKEIQNMGNMSIVVDGQQRLTTTLLFLIALRDTETDEEKKKQVTDFYLKNNNSSFEDKIKLKQVTKDWEMYRALVNNEQATQGIIYNAYLLFVKLINEQKRLKPQIQFEHYILAIKRMNVAIIFLDERPHKGEDPQIIFETLNSLGKPLTLSDLIRNFVLLNMKSNEQSRIYEDIWHPKIENVLNEHTSHFFRDYLQYKTASWFKAISDNNTKEVYQLFKDFVKDNFDTHDDFINDIIRYTKWYKWIISENISDEMSSDKDKSKEIKELIRNIFHDIKAEAFKPFVLGLLEYQQCDIKLHDDKFISILKSIRTYLIRRRVWGLTQGENKSIAPFCNEINKLMTGEVLLDELLSNMPYRLRMPNDDEMKEKLNSINFYEGLKNYRKFILGKIEENNSKVPVDFRNPKITIEHIMPRKLNENWEMEISVTGDREIFERVHKAYLHNIGNLILTEFNSEMGNKSFEEKKNKLRESNLHYRLDITNRKFWDEESIIEHQEKMIEWFLETFPLPEKYKTTENWNTAVVESTTFSPLEKPADEIVEGNKPIELRIFDKTFKVASWREIFIKFIEYLKNNDAFDFGYLIDNEDTVFGAKNEVIIEWSNLKNLLEDRPELSARYKTFKGKTWDKVSNLNDDEIFIHVNISAPVCVSRIANVMNKFNLPENSVEIVLK